MEGRVELLCNETQRTQISHDCHHLLGVIISQQVVHDARVCVGDLSRRSSWYEADVLLEQALRCGELRERFDILKALDVRICFFERHFNFADVIEPCHDCFTLLKHHLALLLASQRCDARQEFTQFFGSGFFGAARRSEVDSDFDGTTQKLTAEMLRIVEVAVVIGGDKESARHVTVASLGMLRGNDGHLQRTLVITLSSHGFVLSS